jgi:predicted lipoprotein with Yx(FWY)xxD motif
MRAVVMGRVLLVVVAVAAFLGAQGSLAAGTAVTLKAATNSQLGEKIVVDSAGFTLYHLMSEPKGAITCTGACRAIWPPLLATGKAKPLAGPGLVASKVGTIKRPDGGVQVTYNGYALYLYKADAHAGQANGQGFQKAWYVLTPAGSILKATMPAAGSPPATAPTTTTTGGGYNY